jgi:hypothetical protein
MPSGAEAQGDATSAEVDAAPRAPVCRPSLDGSDACFAESVDPLRRRAALRAVFTHVERPAAFWVFSILSAPSPDEPDGGRVALAFGSESSQRDCRLEVVADGEPVPITARSRELGCGLDTTVGGLADEQAFDRMASARELILRVRCGEGVVGHAAELSPAQHALFRAYHSRWALHRDGSFAALTAGRQVGPILGR